jgi:hypothetical protein
MLRDAVRRLYRSRESVFQFGGFILRDARKGALLRMRSSRRGEDAAPQDEVLNPHGEERGMPRVSNHEARTPDHNSTQVK